ncbi:MAG: HD domain-containing phosphohydrolase [Candidatus Omnitrophota bacterium]
MKNLFSSFRFRVTSAMIVSMVLLAVINNVLNYHLTFKSQLNSQRVLLENLAKNAALMINPHQLKEVPLNPEGINSSSYQIILEDIKKIKATNPQIEDIYILTPTKKSGVWQFIVDLESTKPNGVIIPAVFPGANYNAGRFREMINGLNHPAADFKLETDEYGTTLSGYAPIRDEFGKPFAVLGMDIDASNIYSMEQRIFKESLIFLLIGIIFAIILGSLISGRVVQPVKQLKIGVDYIKEGNWNHKVRVYGNDEIAQLATSFNDMAQGLELYRQLLRNYFLDSVKSMSILIEARDASTLGHSEKVAYYAEKIALRLGIDPKLVDHFKRVVLLHDIGKVGIRDNVLLKPAGLDQQEFDLMKHHPVMGEKILKPILEDPLMLAIIRNHHERFDGKGYPDGLIQDQIPLFVAIVTVADSYDAMTSNRAYRKALSKEEAMQQLVDHRSLQFNPQVVDVFLEILKEESQIENPPKAV